MGQRPEQLEAVTGIQAGEAGSLDNNNGGRNGKTSRKKINIHEEATHSERIQ